MHLRAGKWLLHVYVHLQTTGGSVVTRVVVSSSCMCEVLRVVSSNSCSSSSTATLFPGMAKLCASSLIHEQQQQQQQQRPCMAWPHCNCFSLHTGGATYCYCDTTT